MFRHSSPRPTPRPVSPVLLAPIIAVLIMAAIGLGATIAEAHTPHPTDSACFKASEWGPAPDTIRPCVRIVGNSPEGGALRFKVSDASGVVRYTGYVNTTYRRIIHVRIVALYEDGSFTWKARSRDGRTVSASVGNLQD